METAFAATGFVSFLTEMLAPLLLCSTIPLGSPPVQDPALTRVAPQQCIFYVGWAGIGTPDPKSPNSAERFLADPEIRHMRAEAARRFPLLLKSLANKDGKNTPAIVVDYVLGFPIDPEATAFWSDLLVTRPCALFISGVKLKPESVELDGALVVNVGDAGEKIGAMFKQIQEQNKKSVAVTVVEGYIEYRMQGIDTLGELRWSVRGKHLICAWGNETPSAVAKRMNGEQPAWFAAVDSDLPVERRAAVLRVDCAALAAAFAAGDKDDREDAKTIENTHIRAVTLVTGLGREDFVSQVLVETDGVAATVLHQMANLPLKREDLSVIPRDATLAMAGRINPGCIAAVLQWIAKDTAKPTAKVTAASIGPKTHTVEFVSYNDESSAKQPGDSAKATKPGFAPAENAVQPGKKSAVAEKHANGSVQEFNWVAEPAVKSVPGPVPIPEHSEGAMASGVLDSLFPFTPLPMPLIDGFSKRFKLPKNGIDAELSAELVASLGDTWRVYTSPSEGCSVFNCVTAVVDVKDRDRLTKLFDKLASRIPPAKDKAKSPNAKASPSMDWAVRKVRFADRDVYYLLRGGDESLGVLTWTLTADGLVCSLSPQNVKAYLLREKGSPSLADEPAAVEALAAKNAPTLLLYEDAREMFRLTYPLIQGMAMSVAANTALPSGGTDPMLLPASPTVAKYLRPAASTVALTPKGVHVTLHQSLPNGNLGSMFYLMLCSLLPADANSWTSSEPDNATVVQNGEVAVKAEESPKPAPLMTFTEKEGPCGMKKSGAFDKDVFTVDIGNKIQGKCKFYIDDFIGRTIINANMSVKNVSKDRRNCQYYVAFFDKNGKLIGCASQGLSDSGLEPGEDTNMGSCLVFLPDGMAETVTSYKVRFYETDKIPAKK